MQKVANKSSKDQLKKVKQDIKLYGVEQLYELTFWIKPSLKAAKGDGSSKNTWYKSLKTRRSSSKNLKLTVKRSFWDELIFDILKPKLILTPA